MMNMDAAAAQAPAAAPANDAAMQTVIALLEELIDVTTTADESNAVALRQLKQELAFRIAGMQKEAA
jgi:hypothetical protein